MKASELLGATREKLTPPGSWTQDADARDADSRPVAHDSARAVCWCLLGAMPGPYMRTDGAGARTFLRQAFGSTDHISMWNDTPGRTQDEVLGVLDRAIALAKEQGE